MVSDTTSETEAALADLFRDPLPPEWCEAHTPAQIAAASAPEVHSAAQIAAPAPRFGEWYPIADAPKDGTAILVGKAGNPREWHLQVAVWRAKSRRWDCSKGTWFSVPTHWMPLPPPPVLP